MKSEHLFHAAYYLVGKLFVVAFDIISVLRPYEFAVYIGKFSLYIVYEQFFEIAFVSAF